MFNNRVTKEKNTQGCPRKKSIGGGWEKKSGRGSVENTIFLQRG